METPGQTVSPCSVELSSGTENKGNIVSNVDFILNT